jgi:predicted RNase H-like HicB family nuclease
MNQYTAVVKQDGDSWIGWIEEIPGVNCQEQSREELLDTLRVTLQEAIEMNRQDAVAAIAGGYEDAIVNPKYQKGSASMPGMQESKGTVSMCVAPSTASS